MHAFCNSVVYLEVHDTWKTYICMLHDNSIITIPQVITRKRESVLIRKRKYKKKQTKMATFENFCTLWSVVTVAFLNNFYTIGLCLKSRFVSHCPWVTFISGRVRILLAIWNESVNLVIMVQRSQTICSSNIYFIHIVRYYIDRL